MTPRRKLDEPAAQLRRLVRQIAEWYELPIADVERLTLRKVLILRDGMGL